MSAFAADVTRHRTRYAAKIELVRIANAGNAAIRAEAHACEAQIAKIAEQEIARARAAGRVEFAAT